MLPDLNVLLNVLARMLVLAAVVVGSIAIVVIRFRDELFGKPKKTDKDQELNPEVELTDEEKGRYPLTLATKPHLIMLGEKMRFQHTQIKGPTGVGKNYYGLLPWLCQDIFRRAGTIILDNKGSMRGQVAAYVKAAGRQHEARYLSLSRPDLSDIYNPLVDPDPHVVAERFFEAFYQDDQTPTPHYKEHAKSFLLDLFTLFHKMNVVPTMEQVRSIAFDQDTLALLLRKAPDCREAREMRIRLVAGMKGDEYRNSFLGLVNKLTAVCGAPYASVLNTTCPSINMREILAKGQILYVDLAADMYQSTYFRVSTLLLMDLTSCLTERYQKPGVKPSFLYLDEFAGLVYPRVCDLFQKARDARVGITFAHQSDGDLKRYGEITAEGIDRNSRNKVIFQVVGDDAKSVAALFGTRWEERKVVNYKTETGIFGGGYSEKGMTPVREKVYVIHPDILKNQATGEAACIIQRDEKGRSLYQTRLDHAPSSIPPLNENELLKPAQGVQLPALELTNPTPKDPPTPRPASPVNPTAIEALKRLGEKRRAEPLPTVDPAGEAPKVPPAPQSSKSVDPTAAKASPKKPRKKPRAEEP